LREKNSVLVSCTHALILPACGKNLSVIRNCDKSGKKYDNAANLFDDLAPLEKE